MAAASSARPDEIAGLALVGAHAERRIALQMLGDRDSPRAPPARYRRRSRRCADRQRRAAARRRTARAGSAAPRRPGFALVARSIDRRRSAALARHAEAAQAAARAPAASPSARQAASGKIAVRRPGAGHRRVALRPAPSAARPGSKRSRPRACAKSCTFGFQPPDTASRSQSSVTVRPRPAAAAALGRTRTRRSAGAPGGPDHRMPGIERDAVGQPPRRRARLGPRIDDRRRPRPRPAPAPRPADRRRHC